jgi:hypothetical protein
VTSARGAALLDVVFASAVCITVTAAAVPVVGGPLDRERTVIAAHHLAGQLQRARFGALSRARAVAVRIELRDGRTNLQLFADGNGNGVSERDIARGIDPALAPSGFLDDHARGVSLRINQRIVDASGAGELAEGDDPLRIGRTALMTFSPLGSATSGTLYVAGHRGPQMAIRVFGGTGRVRVLTFDAQARQWRP